MITVVATAAKSEGCAIVSVTIRIMNNHTYALGDQPEAEANPVSSRLLLVALMLLLFMPEWAIVAVIVYTMCAGGLPR